MAYELHYWPTIQGRGEFVRLALEATGASYIDVARGEEDAGLGTSAMLRCMHDKSLTHPPFAPPFLKDGSVVVGAGLLLGFVLALAAGFLVSSLLVGVRPLDPLVFSLATVVLVIAVAAAGCVPARRATRIDPALAFKSE